MAETSPAKKDMSEQCGREHVRCTQMEARLAELEHDRDILAQAVYALDLTDAVPSGVSVKVAEIWRRVRSRGK